MSGPLSHVVLKNGEVKRSGQSERKDGREFWTWGDFKNWLMDFTRGVVINLNLRFSHWLSHSYNFRVGHYAPGFRILFGLMKSMWDHGFLPYDSESGTLMHWLFSNLKSHFKKLFDTKHVPFSPKFILSTSNISPSLFYQRQKERNIYLLKVAHLHIFTPE